jgi:DNA-binding GntR family transcriptional regulator
VENKQQTTLVDGVFDRLLFKIIEGQIPPGGAVNELALAAEFNVSRGPVREAVKRLQGTGLITKEPYLKARVINLTVADMVQIFQLREAVEAMSIRLATINMTSADIDDMLSEFTSSKGTVEKPVLDIHVRIAEGSGNERIRALLCDELYYLLRLYRVQSGRMPGRKETAYSEHWQILRAMKARDPDLAESLMRAHIARATQTLQNLLVEQSANGHDKAVAHTP